ncbi:MAG: glycosyltransferase family 2 protein [Prevotella sp.]|jgi:glycosyltransferase involved in cell wall biosynthesis
MTSFTIITCTFNAEKELKPTLDSVLSQTYPKVEHLIIDGVSKDGTVAIAEAYKRQSDGAGNGHSVVISSEPDHGLYDAMNKGLKRASGDYLVFLNAGDTLPATTTLEHIAATADKCKELPGVLYGDTDIVDEKGRFLRHRRLQPPDHLTWRSFRRGMLVCHQAFYARTDLARRTPYNLDYRFSADVDWCIRIMKAAEKQHLSLKRVNGVIAHFLDGGMTTKNHQASLRERFSVMAHHYGLVTTVAMHLWFVVRRLFRS